MSTRYVAPTFRKNWPRFSKRLEAWAKQNDAEYALQEQRNGRLHVIDFGDYYIAHYDPNELFKLVEAEVHGNA